MPKISVLSNFSPALGIGRAMVLCNNAELVNPCQAGRSQGVCAAGTAKGCSQPTGGNCEPRTGTTLVGKR